MPVDVHVIKDGLIPDNAVKGIESSTGAPIPRLLAQRARSVCRHLPVMHRYEQNNLAPSTYEKGVAPAYDGLAITWFASTADMKRGTATPNMRWPAPTSARRPPAHHRHP